ncbi:MAG TPA: hypothetical protein VFN35_33700, partial [Ktedonobacteraceae bacterium]|nr:hypothetical protein [Ktedonobacteraceae bacterium]
INQHLPALFARPVADLPENATPVQERQALADALNVSLPANFGQVTLFHLRRLPLIQATVGLSDALVNILPLITLALLILTLIFSTNRRRSLIGFGLGVSLGMLLLYIATRLTLWYSTNTIQTVAARPFVGYMLDAASQSLLVFALVLAGAGLLMAAIVFQVGRAPRLPDLSDDPEPRE